MSATVARGKCSAQTGYTLAASGIRLASDGGDDPLECLVRNVGRCEGEPGIQYTKSGRMQNQSLGEQPGALALASRPLMPELADALVERPHFRSDRHRASGAQPRSLKGRVAIAGIFDEGLPLGVQQRDETSFGDTEQRTQDAAMSQLPDRRHSGEACHTAASAVAD